MAEAGGRVRTFSIGFTGESSFDETAHAREVANLFGTDHQEFIVRPDALELLPRLVWHHDQPFGDSSAIPTYLVSLHTRQHVTVALSGDGGDELFAGYDRFYAARLAEGYARLPRPIRAALEGTLRRLPENTAYRGVVRNANRFVRAASKPLPERYLEWVRFVPDTWLRELIGEQAADAVLDHYAAAFDGQPAGDITARLLDVNLRTYLPDDLLVKADRMSMAVSLEARAPFLDHKLVEFTARLPSSLKLRGRVSKYILKRALRGMLPHHIIERPKHGFGVPIGRWFREGMADFVRDTLLSRRALERGYFAEEAVRGIIRAHLSGRRDLGHALWTLLTFELWQQSFFDGGT
jgi:asparagine synthase (glutamine-hydrolysing)